MRMHAISCTMREAIVLRIYNKIPSRIYIFLKIFDLVWLVVRVDIPQTHHFLDSARFSIFFRLVWLIVSFGFITIDALNFFTKVFIAKLFIVT